MLHRRNGHDSWGRVRQRRVPGERERQDEQRRRDLDRLVTGPPELRSGNPGRDRDARAVACGRLLSRVPYLYRYYREDGSLTSEYVGKPST